MASSVRAVREETNLRSSPAALRFTPPWIDREWPAHGFAGAWSRGPRLAVDTHAAARALSGPHWFLAAAIEPGAGERCHHDAARGLAVAFDGYAVDPPIHQRAAPAAVLDFWARRRDARVNGSFAAALIDERAGTLTLRTDAFGFAPLYYRVDDDLVRFATSADFLVDRASMPDVLALSSLLNHGLIAGDRSLFCGIRRVPLGGAITFSSDGHELSRALHLEAAGTGREPLTHARMDHIEEVFREAVRRCLALDYGPPAIGLSSGHDSRRILGALLRSGIRPHALITRVYQKGGRDLDATYGQQIARACGLAHRVIDPPPASRSARYSDLRRTALGAESSMHDWAVRLHRACPEEPTALFSGFLGDILQESVLRFPGVRQDPGGDLVPIARQFAEQPCARLLARRSTTAADLTDEVQDYLAAYEGLPHATTLAAIALRQRRAIAVQSQLLRPRHLELRPFLDLDFMRAVLDIDPRERLGREVRNGFLQRFYPELAGFRGTAIDPESLDPVADTGEAERERAYLARIARDLPWSTQQRRYRELLSPWGRGLATLTRVAPDTTKRWHWVLRPFLEAGLHADRTRPAWHPAGPQVQREGRTPELHGEAALQES